MNRRFFTDLTFFTERNLFFPQYIELSAKSKGSTYKKKCINLGDKIVFTTSFPTINNGDISHNAKKAWIHEILLLILQKAVMQVITIIYYCSSQQLGTRANTEFVGGGNNILL